jgi:hypothetical protein
MAVAGRGAAAVAVARAPARGTAPETIPGGMAPGRLPEAVPGGPVAIVDFIDRN